MNAWNHIEKPSLFSTATCMLVITRKLETWAFSFSWLHQKPEKHSVILNQLKLQLSIYTSRNKDMQMSFLPYESCLCFSCGSSFSGTSDVPSDHLCPLDRHISMPTSAGKQLKGDSSAISATTRLHHSSSPFSQSQCIGRKLKDCNRIIKFIKMLYSHSLKLCRSAATTLRLAPSNVRDCT